MSSAGRIAAVVGLGATVTTACAKIENRCCIRTGDRCLRERGYEVIGWQ